MKRIAILIAVVLMSVNCFAGIQFKEALRNSEYMIKSVQETDKKIKEYEEKLKGSENDIDTMFALSVLYNCQAMREPVTVGASYKAKDYADKVLKKDPENYYVLTFAGIAHSLVARDDGNVVVKMAEVNTCTGYFDKAVKLANGKNDEYFVRLYRAGSYISFPDMFGKRKIAEEDFTFIESFAEKNPNVVTDGEMLTVFFNRGEIEKSRGKLNDAIKYWNKTVDLAKKNKVDSPYAVRAKKQLDTFAD